MFDFTNNTAGLRGIYMGKDYWHVRGFEVANSKDNGILISGGFNIIEGCTVSRQQRRRHLYHQQFRPRP